ncbi:hypothetical protein LX15_004797 [Streptoalloteichus tenebrarius]|uniref:Scaffolding protein n=1 Tax=Streptoalloteichus tenebrarius (strain ATCC 17920 / DSM 40477 / JCM 4838 / CBS 697.72 / NBRC 16177 / NCIMB 11028 / NRRL B-12390 / A12253. 1 / ISP 5477) TaxID=1933 RepID=A0ABT1HZW5_STRSD|nr:hypothetical protein [Streptoalloteichus tenebrarius]MCP2261077.1 hypothetical protein [Streptoalloteichus tenebrarius]BFF03128.1 hypothetical protein GCM10020241_48030 [Streptoalloteichus tenebrarius]
MGAANESTASDPAGDEPTTGQEAVKPAPGDTGWKAEAAELEKTRRASMSEAEQAIAEAEKRGRAAAVAELGRQVAAARLEAAAAAAGLTLGEVGPLLDMTRFVDPKSGAVDEDGIKAAVAALAKLAPKPTPPRSGAPVTGGGPDQPRRAASLSDAIRGVYGT